MRQDFLVGFVVKKICDFFPKRLGTVFLRFWKTLAYPFFLIFLLPKLNYIVFFFVFVCCITSYVKRLHQNIPCPNQKIAKNLEKLQFFPRDAGILRSKNFFNSGISLNLRLNNHSYRLNIIPQ